MRPESLATAIELDSFATTVSNAIFVACASGTFYYIAVNFGDEVAYIWSQKWTASKIIYLFTKYSGAIFITYTAAIAVSTGWQTAVFYEQVFIPSSPPPIDNGNLFLAVGPMVMLSAEVILQMRVYALYGRKAKMLAIFILLTVVLFAFNVMQFTGIPGEAGKNVCIGSYCIVSSQVSTYMRYTLLNKGSGGAYSIRPMSAIEWIVTSIVELVLFIMVLRKCRQVKRGRVVETSSMSSHKHIVAPQTHDIITIMARDSTSYFASVFTICLIGSVLAFFSETPTTTFSDAITANNMFKSIWFVRICLNAYQAVVITVMTILAPRLLINLRAEYYGPAQTLTGSFQLPWNVGKRGYESSGDV